MSIIRGPRRTGNFYILDKAISEDQRLTWAARGLLIYLLGKPDHWRVSPAALRNETSASRKPTGRDGVYALLDELMAAGYVTRTQERLPSGHLSEVHYMVSEAPPEPLPALPDTVEPYPANPTLARTDEKEKLKKGRKEGKPANFQAPEQQESSQPPAPPPPPPPFFEDKQPQQPEAAPVPEAAPAPAAPVPTLAPQLLDAINAQRLANSKPAWGIKDLRDLSREAAAAGITIEDAANWILESSARNFFLSSYWKAVTPPQARETAPPRAPIAPPAPLPTPTPEQAAEGARIQEEMRQRAAEKRAAAPPVPPTEELQGPKWAIETVKAIRDGQLIGYKGRMLAAEALGISHLALESEMMKTTKR